MIANESDDWKKDRLLEIALTKVNKLETQVDKLETQVDKLETQVDKLELKEENTNRLNLQIKQKNVHNNKLNQKIKSKNNKIDILQYDIKDSTIKIEELKRSLYIEDKRLKTYFKKIEDYQFQNFEDEKTIKHKDKMIEDKDTNLELWIGVGLRQNFILEQITKLELLRPDIDWVKPMIEEIKIPEVSLQIRNRFLPSCLDAHFEFIDEDEETQIYEILSMEASLFSKTIDI